MVTSPAVFDDYAAAYDRWYGSEQGRALFASEVCAIRLLMQEFERPFLEIGIGTGRFAEALGIDAGIDPSVQALAYARARGISVQRATGEALPFAEASFGAVFILFTLCFVRDPDLVLAEARRVLKPGGCLIVGIVNRESAWGALYLRKAAGGHPLYSRARFFDAVELISLLETAGVKIESTASALLLPPASNRYGEDAQTGLSEHAGFLCIRARKVSGGTNGQN
jgi:ubiquinone/menaquinone biosynthesis C-methylase UbiE